MDREIIYIADPMCSWCWGFAPVATRIKEDFAHVAGFRLVLGGLRPGNRAETMDRRFAKTLESHWRRVAEVTGQPFKYAFLETEGFLFDTEPAARAVVAVRRFVPDQAFSFFKAIERAFYVDNVDPTLEASYTPLLEARGIDVVRFAELFHDQEVLRETYRDFDNARRLGARGFPTVAVRKGEHVALLTVGYQPYENLQPALRNYFEVEVEASREDDLSSGKLRQR